MNTLTKKVKLWTIAKFYLILKDCVYYLSVSVTDRTDATLLSHHLHHHHHSIIIIDAIIYYLNFFNCFERY